MMVLIGCTSQSITITSSPSGAGITLNGKDKGNTPVTLILPTDYPFATPESCTYHITAKLKGYQGTTRTLVGHPAFLTDTKPFPNTLNFELLQAQPTSDYKTTDNPLGAISVKPIETAEDNVPPF